MDLGLEGAFPVHRNSINRKLHPSWMTNAYKTWVELPRTRFKVVFANDILREAKASYVPFFETRGSSHQFFTESIVDLVKASEAETFIFPRVDVVVGGFPCQDFSLSGKRLGLSSHKSHQGIITDDIPSEENRGQLYIWMKRVVELTKPKVFIAENVKGLVSLGDVKKIIENDFRSIDKGYVVLEAKVLHAGNYGVPQTRERVIFLGFNKRYLTPSTVKKLESGAIDPYPPQTHYLPNNIDEKLNKFVALRDVLHDLEEPEKSTDPAQQSYSKAKYYGRHVQGQSEINLDSLGPTIRAEHHGNIEFRRLSIEHGGKYAPELKRGLLPRRLTVRECARIQTFPDTYQFIRAASVQGGEFSMSPSNAYKVIGNAVPPLLAYHIATQLQSKWQEIFGDQE